MTGSSRGSTSTTARGLGWKHQKQRERLVRAHHDGTPCWWCGREMHRDPAKNFDGRVLAADHTEVRSLGGDRADRLLHSTCNEQRGDGRNDDLRPAETGVWPPPARGAPSPNPGAILGPPIPRANVLTWDDGPPPLKYVGPPPS